MNNHDAEDPAHTTFVRLRRTRQGASSDELVLSRAAMHLHTFGVLSSIEAGYPGFVSDSCLSAIGTETSVTALELCLAGLWERTACGYRVSDADTLSVAEQIHVRRIELAARCLRNGGHIVDPRHPHVCAKCGTAPDSPAVGRESAPRPPVIGRVEYLPRHDTPEDREPDELTDGDDRADAA